MTPWEFWRLTIREFVAMLEGFFRREDREWYRVGVLGMWILAPYKKKHQRLTPEKLLGRQVTLLPKGPTKT